MIIHVLFLSIRILLVLETVLESLALFAFLVNPDSVIHLHIIGFTEYFLSKSILSLIKKQFVSYSQSFDSAILIKHRFTLSF